MQGNTRIGGNSMRGSVAIILLTTGIQAAAWGLFSPSYRDPNYWKHAAIGLLIGIFLSLPILRVVRVRSLWLSFFVVVCANIAAGGLAAAAVYILRSGFTVEVTSAIAFRGCAVGATGRDWADAHGDGRELCVWD